jgi:hypothetical protein
MARLFERDIYFFNFKIFNIFYLHFLIPFIYSWYYNYFIIDVIEGEVNLKFCRLREQIVDTLIKHYQKRISSNREKQHIKGGINVIVHELSQHC